MKTKSLSSINHSFKCDERSFSFSSLWLWLQVPGRSMRVRMNKLHRTTALAGREVLAGLSVQLRLFLSQVNRRTFVGMGLMGVVAPLSACFYMLFDWRVDKVAGWYHDNYFHFFLLLAPYFFVMFCLLGVWFLFPHRSARAYGLVVPMGYTVSKILWLALVSNDAEFYSVVPLSFVLMGGLLSVFLFIAFDWLAHNVFHRQDAFERRIETLYNGIDLVDGETFKGLFKKSVEEKKAFIKQY